VKSAFPSSYHHYLFLGDGDIKMSNPLQKLINRYLSDKKNKKSEFIKQLGFSNINKGARRLSAFIENPDERNELFKKIISFTDIPAIEFQLAIQAVQLKLDDKLRNQFVPMIRVIPIYYPHPLSGMVHLNIKVPENILDLPYDQEIKVICDLYLNFRSKVEFDVPENWGSGAKGFRYFRNFGEVLVFDKNCQLVE